MNKDILLVIETVSNEKNVSKDIVIEAIEEALKIAVKKKYRLDNNGEHDIDARVTIDRESGTYQSFRRWKVVEEFEEDELKEQGVNIEEAVIKYIEVEEDPGMFEEEFVDFEKTKNLVNLREQILVVHSNIERIGKDLVTQADASETLMKRYPALRGGRKTRKKRKSRRRKRKKNKTKRKRKRRKTKRR